MEIKEVKDAIDLAAKELKDGVSGAQEKATSALADAKKAIEGLELKADKSELEKLNIVLTDLEKSLKDAEDRLTIKFNHKAFKEEKNETFESVLGKALEDATDNIAKFNRGETKKVTLDLDLKAVGAISTGNVTGSTNWGAQSRSGIITNPNAPTHFRDFAKVLAAGPGTDFYFMREDGEGEGAPAPVAEGALKPQFDVDLVEDSVKFETIAGWLLMSRKAMLNIPGLMSFLNMRLPEKLKTVEDQQALYGNGTSPQIKGILTAGNFVAGQVGGATPLVEKIIKDISLLEDTYNRSANGVLLKASDYYTFFLNKASGSGEYDLPQGVTFGADGVLRILGIPVGKLQALATNDYIVGDFKGGVEIYQQEAMQIEMFAQDGTNVRTNQVTVRIEETIAMPVYGSNYFIKGSSSLVAPV